MGKIKLSENSTTVKMNSSSEDIIYDWWIEFDTSDEDVTVEDMYERWSKVVELPSFKEVDMEINNMAITKNSFFEYFKPYFK